ncbi:MAG: class I SAM-dependent methyltransferase [candidate division KSB1 bacterium]|nr:class I SAM-dependent methyltransferase [candidate division KSB1 bacterium]MDZ7336309.1 class I SAM-dependent methyltransferase [candidate division KSB1 bacterium]MDZ7357378.1 class I SAM-dependent methyltransferase [candidate division KSB1 bacterium]MDZ7375483.1 class I SAM-dependent methyltransferase [candidate division KSB1 bacterium]MDZ7398946.1 class I SAM-dependent methyltransferase [candidate division KSB1 bacterium]
MPLHHQTWDNYHKFAEQRAELVVDLLRQFIPLAGIRALDYGCGQGSLARLLAQLGALVTAVDIDPNLQPLFKQTEIQFCLANDDKWLKATYDLIVLQDVLEHVPDADSLFAKLSQILSRKGLLYVSTPNRCSPLNFFLDPHWSLPGVALLSRPLVAFFVQRVFHRDLRPRNDWPALLSIGQLKNLFEQHGFELSFVNTFVAQRLFQSPDSVVSHPLHLAIIGWLKQHHLELWIFRMVNDRYGLFNRLINPTWYIIGRKK